jgi:hypothetical protein
MAARSRQMISRSSMQRTLNSRAMPSLKAVMAIVIGCGGTEDDQRRFATARRRIAAAAPSCALSRPAEATAGSSRCGRAAGARPRPPPEPGRD